MFREQIKLENEFRDLSVSIEITDNERIRRLTIEEDFNILYEIFTEIIEYVRWLKLESKGYRISLDISLETFCRLIDETTHKEYPHSTIEYISETEAIYTTSTSERTIHLTENKLEIDFTDKGSFIFASEVLEKLNFRDHELEKNKITSQMIR